MKIIRYGLFGCLAGIFSSWLIGDELIGIGVCLICILIFELSLKLHRRARS